MPTVEYGWIPDELKERDQWLLWDERNDRPKQPHWNGNHSISWSDPDDWHSFADAKELAEQNEHWGVGYVTAKDNPEYARGLYWVIDIDSGLVDGELADWVPDLEPFEDAMTYMERSPSGTGIHMPIVGHDIPEWWTDSQIDEHTGVDVLANKFCTFTGDVLESSGSGIADVDPTSWLFQAYTNINGENPRVETEHAESGYDGDDELTAEQVREALEHVDSDLAYSQWLRVGMAVYDWDSGSRGKGIFESWSKSNPKWDEKRGQPHIDDIWSGSPNGDVTVGTLVYHAKQGGWQPPRSTPALDAAEDTDKAEKSDSGQSEDDLMGRVRDVIAEADAGDIQIKTARHRIAQILRDEHWFVKPEREVRGWRETLYIYNDREGVYEPRGETVIKRRLERAAGDFMTNQTVNEIVEKVKRMSVARGPQFKTPPERLVVGNGVLDLHTGELEDYNPREYHRTKIDVDWNPDAGEPDAIDSFLHDIVADKDVKTLYRLIAHTLYKEYVTEKAAMLIGGGQNGKSVFLDFVQQFLGDENVSHRALQDFEERFTTNQLQGKLANIHPDMGDHAVKDLSTFKKLTGRDHFTADVKFESPIEFENFATLLFAANEMPVFGEDNHAVWRRWVYVEFPYEFREDKADSKTPEPKQAIMRRLTADEEFEALLLKAQQEIQRWYDGAEWYADAMRPEEVRDKMKKAAEPVYAFASTCLEPDEDGALPKRVVRQTYRAYADAEDLPRLPENEFGQRLVQQPDLRIESKQRRLDGVRTNVYTGVQLTQRGRQLAGKDEPEDGQANVDEVPDAKKAVLDRLHEMVEENDGEPVPKAGVIWGVVNDDLGKIRANGAYEKLKERGDLVESDDGVLPT